MFSIDDFFDFLNYLKGDTVDDLDSNLKSLLLSEKNKTLDLFDAKFDQIAFVSNDYKKLRQFLINWYSSHKTISTVQKNVSDVFSLPDEHLDQLIYSFGFPYHLDISLINKANFFLELVNLYKIKGTPKSIKSLLAFLGMDDIEVCEFWLRKNEDGLLVFRPESVITPETVYTFDWPDVYYSELTNDDPHWFYTENDILSLFNINKIAFPSKSPYFGLKPIYDLTSRSNPVIALLVNRVRSQYDSYISSGTVPYRDLKLTKLPFEVCLLELYLSVCYVLNVIYNRADDPALESLFSTLLCYNGTNTDISDVVDEYKNLVKTTTYTRSQIKTKQAELVSLFYKQKANFQRNNSSISTLLNNINHELKVVLDLYISENKGYEILVLLIQDLASWIYSNFGSTYTTVLSLILGIESFTKLNEVINFFKPYRARLTLLQSGIINKAPLLESIKMEDVFGNITSQLTAIDFDTADSEPCCDLISCDSTAGIELRYSRETYDCGSKFDVGFAYDDNDSLHIKSTTSYIDLFTSPKPLDSTTCIQTDIVLDSYGNVVVSQQSAGWIDYDDGGYFDWQTLNDTAMIYVQSLVPPVYPMICYWIPDSGGSVEFAYYGSWIKSAIVSGNVDDLGNIVYNNDKTKIYVPYVTTT